MVEEDVALGGPGDADEEDGERGPSDESGAAGEIGAREKYERGRAEIREGWSGKELAVESKIFRGRGAIGGARQTKVSVVVDKGLMGSVVRRSSRGSGSQD